MINIKKYLLAENTYVFLLSALLISLMLPYAYSTAIAFLLFVTALISIRHHKIKFRKELLIPILFYGLMGLSLFWSIDFDKSSRGLERQLYFVLVPLSFILMPPLSRKTLLRVFYAFAVGTAILFLVFLVYSTFRYFEKDTFGVYFYHSLVFLFDLNAIYISAMVSLSLLFLIFYGKRETINYLLIGLLTVFLVMLTSKNIIAVTAVAVFAGIFLSKKISLKRKLIILFSGLIVAVLLFFSPIKERWDQEINSDITEVLTLEKFKILYPWTGTTLRVFQARIFYELIGEKDVFWNGFGINAAQGMIAQKQEYYELYCGFSTYDFHNQYIQSFAELGVFGFLFLILFFLFILKDYRRHRELMNVFFFIIFASVLITESYLWRQYGMIHFLVIYGLLLKMHPLTQRLNSNHENIN